MTTTATMSPSPSPSTIKTPVVKVQAGTGWSSSCVNGLRSTRVARCAHLCAMACSSVRGVTCIRPYIYICRSHAHLGEKRTKNENATGISQRDANHYEFLNEPETQSKIVSSFVAHWTAHVKPKWTGPASCK